MSRNFYWKLAFVVFVVGWSLYEIYPPSNRDLVQHFRERATRPDATFSNILEQVTVLQAQRPDRAYANLQQAIGTNDLTRYFPFYVEAKDELSPTTYILNRLQREAAGKIKLGLDLQGGTSFLVAMDTNRLFEIEIITNKLGQIETVTNSLGELEGALSQAVEVVRKRVDKFGVAEPIIQPAGNNQILIQLPGLSEEARERAKATIQKVAYLEFRLVHENNDALIEQGEVPPGYELLSRVSTSRTGKRQTERYLVKKRPEMVGGVKSAGVTRNNLGQPEISFRLEAAAAAKFADITSQNVGRLLAIVLDGELQTAPRIKTEIGGGSGVIEGDYTPQEAYQLANVLENPLRAPLNIIYSRDVDPTLGKDSIRSGINAAVYGIIAVAIFMLVYYLVAGLVANAALVLNIIVLLGVMCSINATLTLPGIAGIVLTIGMAVDANVLIFERVREESAAGKSMRGALAAGYNKAFGTIFDTNLTTLISSSILIAMGTGPVQGFGVTLTIGVVVSMFTALVVTRLIFDWLLAKNLLKSLRMLHIIRASKIDFLRWAVPAFAASWLLIIVGMSYGVFIRGQHALGVEFTGGDEIILGFDQKQSIGVDKIRESVAKAVPGEALISYQKDVASGVRTLRITTRSVGGDTSESAGAATTSKVLSQLKQDFPSAQFTGLSTNHVGPTVGQEIQRTAIIASLIAMLGILTYVAFRYEFSFAVGAVVAILHDVLMTAGWYFLAGHEMNATTVAAFLTIIGFSINDTIVIFDRIREDLKLGVRGTFREVMNRAMNECLSRTIITSGTVFLATLSLYIFGGGAINDFAFTFLVGIITGTYSSIYIASALVLWWHKGERPRIGSQVSVDGLATPAPSKA